VTTHGDSYFSLGHHIDRCEVEMGHRHFCDVAGQYWDCPGVAVRPWLGNLDPMTCTCLLHDPSPIDADHSNCPIELVVCPEHLGLSSLDLSPSEPLHACPRTIKEDIASASQQAIGFCLWCNRNFDSVEECMLHLANDSKACSVFQQFKMVCPAFFVPV
jgi:hypothetical protein